MGRHKDQWVKQKFMKWKQITSVTIQKPAKWNSDNMHNAIGEVAMNDESSRCTWTGEEIGERCEAVVGGHAARNTKKTQQ